MNKNNPESTKEFYFTLDDYLKGKFIIPDKDYIYYINNTVFYSRWINYIEKLDQVYKFRNSLLGRFINLFNGSVPQIKLPEDKKIVFLGYKEKSFNFFIETPT